MIISKTKPYYDFEEIRSFFSFEKDSIEKFEKEFAKKTKTKYSLSFAYGRSALYAYLKSRKITKSDIAVPAYTCIVVPNTIVSSENNPLFMDVEKNSFLVNWKNLKLTNKTKLIIPTHLYGFKNDYSCLFEKINDSKKDISIIEDAALAIGLKGVGKKTDGAFYSFNIAKQLCTFDGGIFVTNNEEIYNNMKEYRDNNFKKITFTNSIKKRILFYMSYLIFANSIYPITYKAYSFLNKDKKMLSNWDTSKIDMPNDYDTLFSSFQAKIALAQLKKIEKNIEKRRKIAKKYYRSLKDIPSISIPKYDKNCTYSHFPIFVKNKSNFLNLLNKNNLNIGDQFDFDYSVPHTKAYNNLNNLSLNLFKNSLYAANHIITLPIRPNLTLKEQEFVIQKIKEIK